nr:histidine kinase [Rhodoferax sp.]
MFKAIGNLIYRTPWWGVLLAGVTTLVVLVLFALPVQVIHMVDSAATPAERRSIQREVNQVVTGRLLDVAQSVVSTVKKRSTDPERHRELDRALAEIARAREELARAPNSADARALDRAREAGEQAMETATEAAESALEAATEAREAVQETRADAIERLRDKGLDIANARKSFDQLLGSARDNESATRDALAAIRSARHAASASSSQPPNPPGVVPLSDASATVELSPERKISIHAKVNGDVVRAALGSVLILTFIPLFLVLLVIKFFLGRSRNALAVAARKTREAELSDVSRQVTEARLQTLQDQVEPHFLYNTLANVQALNEVDPPAASQMVGHLIQYLRASLPKMRESSSTAGQELDLVRAYLNILQMRMGSRLEFSITAADDLLACAFPPMMLPSLVENAIKHGLEPQRDGGRIDIVFARVPRSEGQYLQVTVTDTGRGLPAQPTTMGGGVGLTNLRERLAALYGVRGRFTLASHAPHGAVATIEVPLQSAAAYQASQPENWTAHTAASTRVAPVRPKGWRRLWYATSKTHGVWARLLVRTFLVLVVVLIGVLLAGLLALMTGWLPVVVGDVRLDGFESFAVGSVGLLVGFGACALALAIMLAVVYGLGFLFAALMVFIPTVILLALFPVLAPFVLMVLGLWWLVTLSRRNA